MQEDICLEPAVAANCYHCGETCRDDAFALSGKNFCCAGCRAVFELLTATGLDDFYTFDKSAGVKVKTVGGKERFRYLDEPAVRQRIVDYTDDRITRVTFRLPAMHCIACVWLLENLFRLQDGIGETVVNFPRKEASIRFDTGRVKLSELVGLLASLGYEPDLKLSDLEGARHRPSRRLWLQLGVAGFAFGNIMLMSISSYLGLDAVDGPGLRRMFGIVSFVLAGPVVFYSAQDYWRAGWSSLCRRVITIELPIALGIAALFAQSVVDMLIGRGVGYFDSLTGLIFFLLCGRWFQQKTYERLAFDRDYKSFFPLSVTRKADDGEGQVALSEIRVGDRLVLRNGELIPADAVLRNGDALIDYSFVTGEADPLEKKPGDYLYAGGRQAGAMIEVETVKPVSQSYLTSLWNQEIFQRPKTSTIETLTNRYSKGFTLVVVSVALLSAAFWSFTDGHRALKAFVSVLIVACPCALALAAPFTLGSAQRVAGRRGVYLKNPGVIETLARIDSIVFDKTGTLSAAGAAAVSFCGRPLTPRETDMIYSLTRQSTHPCSVRISEMLASSTTARVVRSFVETPGGGLEGQIDGVEIEIGSAAWLRSRDIGVPASGGTVHVAFNGQYRGCFVLVSAVRPKIAGLLRGLSGRFRLALLSGDGEKERPQFTELLGPAAELHFKQSPLDKLNFIRALQKSGGKVMMVGDGLNDAGALKQSDLGVAVVENVNAFAPASDVVLTAGFLPDLGALLAFSKRSVGVVKLSFAISALYNLTGISIAASGNLSPIFCAILMPLSSVTVVLFACTATVFAARLAGMGAVREVSL